MKNAIRLGMLSAALMLSVSAFAATIEIKPVEIKPIEVKPMTSVGTQGQSSGGLNFGSMNKAKPTNLEAQSCSAGSIADGIYNQIKDIAPDISPNDVKDVVAGGYVNLGNCGKSLTSLHAEPLANEIRISKVEKDCLSGQSPSGHPKRTECLVKGNEVALGLPHDAAIENQAALEACKYNN